MMTKTYQRCLHVFECFYWYFFLQMKMHLVLKQMALKVSVHFILFKHYTLIGRIIIIQNEIFIFPALNDHNLIHLWRKHFQQTYDVFVTQNILIIVAWTNQSRIAFQLPVFKTLNYVNLSNYSYRTYSI